MLGSISFGGNNDPTLEIEMKNFQVKVSRLQHWLLISNKPLLPS